MKTIKDIEVLKGVKVLVRVDYNVPVAHGVVVDDFRIRKSLKTISFLKDKGARIILVSHIESGDKMSSGEPSLRPVADQLKKLGVMCTFVENYRNANLVVSTLNDGDIILLENVRINEGEKKNDPEFAKALASLADIYVNEAFPVSHRAHTSVVAITEFLPSYAGFVFEEEVEYLSAAFHPKHPFIFVLGGAKFETKVPLIEKFMETADTVFVGGALANNFFKEKGLNVGASLVSPQDFNLKRYFNNPKLLLPVDVEVTDADGIVKTKKVIDVADRDVIMDAGPKTVALLQKILSEKPAQVLWNGPLGAYEKGFKNPTIAVAKAIAKSSVKDGVNSIVGGADTLATISEIKEVTGTAIEADFSFVSTGGGAMLDFLAHETLPGIEALEKNALKN